jgi:wyosine [tRNA(Phe)-imidazoG37] synthetase (radical SAM superfamily)
MSPAEPGTAGSDAFRYHPRTFEDTRFAYAVVSRRAGGVSIGVNLNPDKACNFDCVYCQVDRSVPGRDREVDLDVMETEVRRLLAAVVDGSIYESPRFATIDPRYRHPADIAFSGDGEPTSFRSFEEAVRRVVCVRDSFDMQRIKIRLITNAAGLDRADVRNGVAHMMANNGEIWAKLDAGTEAYYREICRTAIPFHRVLANIERAARDHSVVIQSLFLRYRGHGPDEDEIGAYANRLGEILRTGGRITWTQIYTIARPPAESEAAPLARRDLETIADRVRALGIRAETFPNPDEAF